MGSGFGGTIGDGLNVKANHEKTMASLARGIPLAAANKVPNLITFFGNRGGCRTTRRWRTASRR